MGSLEQAGAAASDARVLALKVAYLERVNEEMRMRLKRIEQMANPGYEHG
jgi:hypothetical protein